MVYLSKANILSVTAFVYVTTYVLLVQCSVYDNNPSRIAFITWYWARIQNLATQIFEKEVNFLNRMKKALYKPSMLLFILQRRHYSRKLITSEKYVINVCFIFQ